MEIKIYVTNKTENFEIIQVNIKCFFIVGTFLLRVQLYLIQVIYLKVILTSLSYINN